MDTSHDCKQGASMSTICAKLENIESDISEIKVSQREFMEKMEKMMVNSAKYPSPDYVNKAIAKLDGHDLFFRIIWVVLGFAWVALLFVLDKMWGRV